MLVRQDIIDYNAIFDHIHIYSIDQQARPNSHVQQQDIAHQQASRNHPTRVTSLVRFAMRNTRNKFPQDENSFNRKRVQYLFHQSGISPLIQIEKVLQS